MTLQQSIVTLLTADPGVSSLVGSRIYDRTLPTTPTLPAIVFQLVSDPRTYAQDGAQTATPRIQFTCWGKTPAAASGLADALEGALDLVTRDQILILFVENRIASHEAGTGLYKEIVDMSAIRSI